MEIKCKCGGFIPSQGMCSYIIVGGKSCGFDGECHHQDKQLPVEMQEALENAGIKMEDK